MNEKNIEIDLVYLGHSVNLNVYFFIKRASEDRWMWW